MSQLEDRFEIAAARAQNLPDEPSNDDMLSLYALFKQATAGDVAGDRPGMTDVQGRAKYDAWAELEGMSTEEAMQQYVDLVEDLRERLG
ncbi:MAG: acyl-CoA-binding protein [Bradymonadaceae bacterium]